MVYLDKANKNITAGNELIQLYQDELSLGLKSIRP